MHTEDAVYDSAAGGLLRVMSSIFVCVFLGAVSMYYYTMVITVLLLYYYLTNQHRIHLPSECWIFFMTRRPNPHIILQKTAMNSQINQ